MSPKPEGTPAASAARQGDAKMEGKGKGVATDDPGQEAPRQPDSDASSSVMSRLAKSAIGLSSSVLQGTTSANELADVASAGKAGASSSSSNKPETLTGASSTARASSSDRAGGFRSGQAESHVAAEEAAFSDFLDNTNVFVPTDPVGLEKAWQAVGPVNAKSNSYELPRGAAVTSVGEQQEQDGVEVVRLLSQTDDEMPDFEDSPRLSEAELKSLRHALFENGSPAQISASDWSNILNFVPDFLRGQDGRHGEAAAHNSFMNLGVTDTVGAGQLWLEEWNRVLTGYTDEVWGDLADLVHEARTEVQQIRSRQDEHMQKPDPIALRRLQSVLTRVRARL